MQDVAVQALYFIPPVRAAFLSIRLDPQREFSLVDELALLFRMLAAPGSKICQASNMLRALRQSREAAALGLVEGNEQRHDAIAIDIEACDAR
jgi:Ubiquitin carboxyl-terminal hydrolase